MNDATGTVGGERWVAPSADAAGPAPYEFDPYTPGVPPGLFEGEDPPPVLRPDPRFEQEDADRLARLEAAEAELARDIEGWSPELAADIAAWSQARGFTAEELAAVEDPREVKVLHLAMMGERALAEQAHARRFGGFRPPTQVGAPDQPADAPKGSHSRNGNACGASKKNGPRRAARA